MMNSFKFPPIRAVPIQRTFSIDGGEHRLVLEPGWHNAMAQGQKIDWAKISKKLIEKNAMQFGSEINNKNFNFSRTQALIPPALFSLGHALSFLARVFDATRDQRFLAAAHRALALFDVVYGNIYILH